MRDEGESRFRRWLVDKLKRSRWVTYNADTVESVARRIGVQPDMIEQAQRELSAAQKAEGRQPIVLGTGRPAPRARRQIDLDMPKVVFEDWKLYCKTRDLPGSVVIRGLVHTMLSGPENPSWIGRRWRYRGKMLRLEGYAAVYQQGWPWNVKTDVSEGASRALTQRARNLGCKPTALMRGAVIDLLEGRTKRLNIVTSAVAMWDDETRYWLGEPRVDTT